MSNIIIGAFENYELEPRPEVVSIEDSGVVNHPPGIKWYYRYSPDTVWYDVNGNVKPRKPNDHLRLRPFCGFANIEEKKRYLKWRKAEKQNNTNNFIW